MGAVRLGTRRRRLPHHKVGPLVATVVANLARGGNLARPRVLVGLLWSVLRHLEPHILESSALVILADRLLVNLSTPHLLFGSRPDRVQHVRPWYRLACLCLCRLETILHFGHALKEKTPLAERVDSGADYMGVMDVAAFSHLPAGGARHGVCPEWSHQLMNVPRLTSVVVEHYAARS